MNVRSDPQIETFRSSLASILTGTPVGHAMSERFGARYGELSTLLLNATSPPPPRRDEELVCAWITCCWAIPRCGSATNCSPEDQA
jgi:hypothetical protein